MTCEERKRKAIFDSAGECAAYAAQLRMHAAVKTDTFTVIEVTDGFIVEQDCPVRPHGLYWDDGQFESLEELRA